MSWFRLDDKSHSNRKVVAAGNAAWGLYCRCGAYAADNLTDGFVPEQIARLFGDDTLIGALLEHRLWRRARGGYKMPDYLQYNPSRQAVENQREANKTRQQRHRHGVTNTVTNNTPTRPDPLNGSAVTSTERSSPRPLPKHNFESFKTSGVVAARQPPPFAEAQQRAVHPPGHDTQQPAPDRQPPA